MKNIKNNLELDSIKEMIDRNRFSLCNCLLDAEKLTGDKTNNLDIDELEDIVQNRIERLIILEASKDKMTYRITQYKINLDMWIGGELYRIENWFAYDKKTGSFEDSEVFADNDYMN